MDKPFCLRVRLDFRGVTKRRFPLSNRSGRQVAEDIREHKVNLLRNLPVQGIEVEDVDMNMETYVVYDDNRGCEAAYAPATLTIRADNLEDALKFVLREEFRKVELLEPDELVLSKHQLEKLLFKIGEGMHRCRVELERKLAGR